MGVCVQMNIVKLRYIMEQNNECSEPRSSMFAIHTSTAVLYVVDNTLSFFRAKLEAVIFVPPSFFWLKYATSNRAV